MKQFKIVWRDVEDEAQSETRGPSNILWLLEQTDFNAKEVEAIMELPVGGQVVIEETTYVIRTEDAQ